MAEWTQERIACVRRGEAVTLAEWQELLDLAARGLAATENAAKARALNNKELPLRAKIGDGRLSIGIGVNTLCRAISISPHSDLARIFDPAMVDDPGDLLAIVDEAAFATDICRAINQEDEDGSTPLIRMIEAAAMDAIEQGSEGVDAPNKTGESDG